MQDHETSQDTAAAATGDRRHFPCEQCGGDLEFRPGEDHLVCPHCGHEHRIDNDADRAAALLERDFDRALRARLDAAEIEETRVVACPNCGARTEFDESDQAGWCPFCDTPVVTGTGTHRHIKPAAVLPFAIGETAARDAMKTWLGRLWFAPNGLQDYARKGRTMNGIYVPYWTYDARTHSRYRGARGEYYWVTRTVVRDGERKQVRERKTRWYPARGTVARHFDDLLVLASRSLPKSYTDALEPWDLTALEAYQPDYLAGFRAEGYQVELDEGFAEARDRMDEVIRQDVRRDIGGDTQRIHDVDSSYDDITFKHVLLPVWLAAYKYRGKTYRFVVNGQTGKVKGERPWSAWKIAIAVTLAVFVAGAVGYVAYLNQ